jgi:phytoene dehydrogenase-like protein
LSFQIIVIGNGADALVGAHLLARAGRQVLVIEERAPLAQDEGWVPPQVIGELGLQLNVEAPDPWATVSLPDGGELHLWRDIARSVESIKRVSPRDSARWPDFCRRMAAIARLFEQLYTEAPADPLGLRLALRVRRLGRHGMEDLMRVLPMSVAELLDDWFECDALKGALGAMGVRHLQQGPRSGGTAFRLVHHHVGSPEGVFRPPRSNLSSVLRQRPGVYIKPAEVKKIRLKAGRVEGVVLDGGEEIAAPLVVSGVDPRRTLLELADPAWLDPELARALHNLRRRGVAARITFNSAHPRMVVAPSLDYLERAYDEVKYGRVSRQPYLEAVPTENGTDVHFQYAPYRRADGEWNDARRSELLETTRRLLPALAQAQASVLAPSDLEREEGWPEGQAYHAELTLDQALWMRPLPELARYRMPIEGLWLCGPGTHPGGGIAGASGFNCAKEILHRGLK